MRAERQNLIPLVEGYGDNEQGHLVLQVTDVLMSLGAVDGKQPKPYSTKQFLALLTPGGADLPPSIFTFS